MICYELGMAARYVAGTQDADPEIAQRIWANKDTGCIGKQALEYGRFRSPSADADRS
jgi:hypothetical protein